MCFPLLLHVPQVVRIAQINITRGDHGSQYTTFKKNLRPFCASRDIKLM